MKILLMLGVRSPQSIACGVGASVSRIKQYNSDRIVSRLWFYTWYYRCYSLMSIICMKLDPGMHIGMHLVCFSKTRCESLEQRFFIGKGEESKAEERKGRWMECLGQRKQLNPFLWNTVAATWFHMKENIYSHLWFSLSFGGSRKHLCH
jgi:hypothetical protein